ncbi:hypothetical protein B0H11DRAFT_1924998 [Mycena galericulata]|nr:hypothetical protein B0H11DRAFT_1924998 [Mycena galericulata]
MTSSTPPAAGTESSVPVAAQAQSSGANAAAALQFFVNAIAALNPVSQSQSQPVVSASATQTPAAPAPAAPPVISAPADPPRVPEPAMFHIRGPWIAGHLYHVVPTGPLMPIAENATDEEQPTWYCITKGRYVGITLSNALAVAAGANLRGGSAMKGYTGQALALAAFNELLAYPGMVSVVA